MQHSYLLIPDTEPMADQSTDTTKLQFCEPMGFIGVTYGNMGERLLVEARMTQ